MKNKTLYLPGFHLQTLRRKPRSAHQVLAQKLDDIRQKTFNQLSACFDHLIPSHRLKPAESGVLSRRRIYSKENTFWAFFSQVLDNDGSCQAAVRKLQSYLALTSDTVPVSSTSAYCQARQKLSLSELEGVLQDTVHRLQPRLDPALLQGRRVIVADGTGLSMPDTPQNQQQWPQSLSQKPGCGFPQASACACFCLQTGGLISYRLGNKKSSELPLLRQQWSSFEANDIFLGDKGFCSYFDLSAFKDRGVDSVVSLARRPVVTAGNALKVLGEGDLLIQWQKPKRRRNAAYSDQQWQALPEHLTLRQIKVVITQPGFRGALFHIVTTLLDPVKYPADQIIELYRQRWDVELFFRDIKATLGMDILRCKTPDMIRKEIAMHWIVYNCIRGLMVDAVKAEKAPVRRLSFAASVQALRQWEPMMVQAKNSPTEQRRLVALLRAVIAETIVPNRPDRGEPRAVKRRPKNYQLMTAPRHEMMEQAHRGRYGAEGA
jgi:hypothetical protein